MYVLQSDYIKKKKKSIIKRFTVHANNQILISINEFQHKNKCKQRFMCFRIWRFLQVLVSTRNIKALYMAINVF